MLPKMTIQKEYSLIDSFKLAFSGIFAVIKKERNVKIHLLATVVVVFLGVILGITKTEWLAIILIIAAILAAETFNSAIEETCDLLKEENNLEYRRTKLIRDTSAGAVLILTLASVVIGLIIFLPYLL